MAEQTVSAATTVWTSVVAGFTSFMEFLPALLGGLVVLLVGWLIAKFVGGIVRRMLLALHVDRALASSQLGGELSQRAPTLLISGIVSTLAKWFVFLIFVQAAANVLRMPQVTAIINSILLFLPNLVVALAILIVGTVVADFVAKMVGSSVNLTKVRNSEVVSTIARYAVIGFAVIASVNQLGIATNLINILFAGFVGSLALALGLAFGLGGQGVASQITRDWYEGSNESARLKVVSDPGKGPRAGKTQG